MHCRPWPSVVVLVAALAPAAEIQMADGTFYYGVTITRRDAVAFECFTQRGRTLLPVVDIATIDGVRMAMIPDNAYPVRALPGRCPPSRRRRSRALNPCPLISPPPRRPRRRPVAAVAHAPLPRPGRVSPARRQRAAALRPRPPPRRNPSVPLRRRRCRSNLPWILLTAAVFCALWGCRSWRVWRDRRHEGEGTSATRFWLIAVVAVLPIAGYLLYEIARWWKAAPVDPLRPPPPSPRCASSSFSTRTTGPSSSRRARKPPGWKTPRACSRTRCSTAPATCTSNPARTECRVRYRIDGVMQPRMKFTADEGLRLISALKSVAQLDIAERRKAQDGRFAGRSGEQEVDFRAATTPSVYGEKLVLRILDQKTGLRGLSDLGMSEAMMGRFAEVIQSRSGMILATGPTGSGKTSSLYAALSQLDAVRLNIVTIEDPVEYELAGATQIPVNLRAGITYESGLRSILRQDPDVILVGEMRDLEAAQIALRSALTGHLMFTSLHTRDAVGTIHRSGGNGHRAPPASVGVVRGDGATVGAGALPGVPGGLPVPGQRTGGNRPGTAGGRGRFTGRWAAAGARAAATSDAREFSRCSSSTTISGRRSTRARPRRRLTLDGAHEGLPRLPGGWRAESAARPYERGRSAQGHLRLFPPWSNLEPRSIGQAMEGCRASAPPADDFGGQSRLLPPSTPLPLALHAPARGRRCVCPTLFYRSRLINLGEALVARRPERARGRGGEARGKRRRGVWRKGGRDPVRA